MKKFLIPAAVTLVAALPAFAAMAAADTTAPAAATTQTNVKPHPAQALVAWSTLAETKDLAGAPVYDRDGKTVGDVVKVVNGKAGKPAKLIVAIKDVAGVSAKTVALGGKRVVVSGEGDNARLVLHMPTQKLENLPEYKA